MKPTCQVHLLEEPCPACIAEAQEINEEMDTLRTRVTEAEEGRDEAVADLRALGRDHTALLHTAARQAVRIRRLTRVAEGRRMQYLITEKSRDQWWRDYRDLEEDMKLVQHERDEANAGVAAMRTAAMSALSACTEYWEERCSHNKMLSALRALQIHLASDAGRAWLEERERIRTLIRRLRHRLERGSRQGDVDAGSCRYLVEWIDEAAPGE